MHRYESLLSWQAHTGETYATQFSPDETSIYSMGSDGKVSVVSKYFVE